MESINFDHRLIFEKLNKFQPKELDIPELKKSAILIPIYPKTKSFHIIMTARSRSCSAPETISLEEALISLTSTTRGTSGR